MATVLLSSVVFVCSALAQQPVTTSRNDNTRSGANTNEVLLTPTNVNKGSFGHLFSFPVDYQVLAQPLYVPNVTINSTQYGYQGTVHNVVYVVSQMNSVYAIDGDNGSALWYASMNDGGVPASGHYLPCGDGGGFLSEGIVGTPVIDLTTTPDPTMYLDAKTVINGTVEHNLHALDITTGLDEVPPVLIAASSVSISNPNTPVKFNALHQKNRPGALLLNGILYLGYGSNSCNDSNTGWVLAYDANPSDPTYMQQLGAFNTSPNIGLTSIWETGNGLAADDEGNIFVSTAESANYGNQSFSNSILKLTPPPWSPQPQTQANPQPADFFTPSDVQYLDSNDLDISSVGPLILPDQTGFYPHIVVASGKQGIVYALNRDDMGGYDGPNGVDNDLQEFPLIVGGLLMCSPAYWNGTVYFGPDGAPLQSFQVTGGTDPGPLIPAANSTARYVGAHSPSISANGNTNGILWVLSGNNLEALDAVSMGLLYSSSQSGSRDKFPKLAHFSTQTVADGRVYVATASTLEAFGLFHVLSIVGGGNQTAQVMTQLPLPIQITATNPYTGQPDQGITVTFSDGNKGGTFSSPTAVTDVNGSASTTYTFGKTAGVYTITVSAPNYGNVTTAETATPGAAQSLISIGGGSQTGPAGSVLPNPVQARALDAYKNAVPGVTVNFASAKGGTANPASVVTNSAGAAVTSFTLPTNVGKVTLVASSPGITKSLNFPETAIAGPPASVSVTGGNNQAAPAGTTLPQALTVLVADQYGNPVSGASVTFSDGGAGGTFNNPNPATTNASGIATQSYTLPAVQGPVTITASVAGVSNPAVFNETAQ